MLDLLKNSLKVSVLGEEQMLTISGSGTCAAITASPCNQSEPHTESCNGGEGGVVYTELSKAEALEVISELGGRWCCDSCGSASWL